MELSPDSTLLQVRHGQFVLLLNKGLRHKKERGGMKFGEFLIKTQLQLSAREQHILLFPDCQGLPAKCRDRRS